MSEEAARTVFLAAGEDSGDLHGAALARELRRREPRLRLVGMGGSRMAEAGVELRAELDRLAVMGFAEVARRLPDLLRLRWEIRRHLKRDEPDLLVPIDYPGFNLSLACWARRRGIPVLYYIAPQVWAWRRGRARRLARCCDRICVVLPFEKGLLERHGARVRFVGHPLLDSVGGSERESAGTPGFAAAATGSGPPVLGLFPGSRQQEVERILPPFLEAARRLRRERSSLRIEIARARDLPNSAYPEDGRSRLRPPEQVMANATAAFTKSGTVTLELALAGVPMVVGYRMNPLTYRLARRLVRVNHIALVNLVADRRLVPELLQDELTPERLVEEGRPLLDPEGALRRRVRDGLARVRDRLGEPGCTRRVANSALELLERPVRT